MKLIHNGEIKSTEEKLFGLENRSFRYGDSLFESIRLINGKPVFLDKHFQRLEKSAELLKMELDNLSFQSLQSDINQLAKVNNIEKGGRARLSVYRNDGGLYSPEENCCSYLLELQPYPQNEFSLNSKGLTIDISQGIQKPVNFLSGIKSGNALLYILAAEEAQHRNMDELLLANQNELIIEGTSSNLFLVKEAKLHTASLESACLSGIMRNQIIDLAKSNDIIVIETDGFDEQDLLEADELFLTNAIQGIKWIVAFRKKRYFHQASGKLVELLNKSV